MRAMQVTELGHPLSLRDVPQPTAAAGEVVVKIHTCGLNFGDTLAISPPLIVSDEEIAQIGAVMLESLNRVMEERP